jgi:hypothetical protein
MRLVEKIGVRGEETGPLEPFEFPAHGEEATEDGEHVCSIAMGATELHTDSPVRVADHTPTFIHALPPPTPASLARHRKRTKAATRGRHPLSSPAHLPYLLMKMMKSKTHVVILEKPAHTT